MANPLIGLGTLNRLLASVTWVSFPALNVTSSYLAPEGIDLIPEGQATTMLPMMTGLVTSPEPYMTLRVVIHLAKSQSLADAYKSQMEISTLLGDGTIRLDTSTMGPYTINNAAIGSVNQISLSGRDVGWVVTCIGSYNVNSALWP